MNDSYDSSDGSARSDIESIIEAYKKDVDRSLLRENLKLTPEQRVRRLMAFLRFTEELRRAGRNLQ